jgi:HEAT repeat protein
MKGNFVLILLVAVVTSGCAYSMVQQHEREKADISTLRTMLKASDPGDRAFAAYSLGRLRDEDSVQALTDALRDPSPDVRWAAADGLAMLGDTAIHALAYLRTIAGTDKNEAVRQAAAGAVKRITQ